MKKLFSIMLGLLLVFALGTGVYAAADKTATAKNQEKWNVAAATELKDLGLIMDVRYNASALKAKPTQADLNHLAVMIKQDTTSETDPDAQLDSGYFYAYILAVLGYEPGTDYEPEGAADFAGSVGLPVYSEEDFDLGAFCTIIDQALKTQTKEGLQLFDVLVQEGIFDAYNSSRTVPGQLIYDGKTYPVFKFDQAIYEQVFVEAPVDSDLDGKRDLIAVWIKRPLETDQGMKTPVIYEFRPYSAGTTDAYDDDAYNNNIIDAVLEEAEESTNTTAHDFRYKSNNGQLPKARIPEGIAAAEKPDAFPEGVSVNRYDYWLVRGYAVVFAAGIGTHYSEGITTCGSEEEILAAKSVVDWLCGRNKAYTDKTGNIQVKAEWSDGNVAMTGRSYAGTVPFAVAATGVQGLKTIVPIAGITNWYDYYRANGTPSGALYYPGDDCDLLADYCMSRMLDETDYAAVADVYTAALEQMRQDTAKLSGDYNLFWDERNYANNANKIKASALIFHGLNDFNVKTKQFDLMYQAFLQKQNDVKLVLHQGAHMTPENIANFDYYGLLNQWFAYWLNGEENGVLLTPNVQIQSNTDLSWTSYDAWSEETQSVTYYADNEHALQSDVGTGESAFTSDLDGVFDTSEPWNEYASDNLYQWQDDIAGEEGNEALRAQFVTAPLDDEMQISGTINVNIRAKSDYPTGILSAMLVDYAPGDMEAIDLKMYSENVPTDVVVEDGIYQGGGLAPIDQIQFQTTAMEHKIISRGWMDIQNRTSIYRVDTVTPDEYYQFTIDLQPMHYTVKAGHQLALVIYSVDVPFTYWPAQITNFTIDHAGTSVEIPVIK